MFSIAFAHAPVSVQARLGVALPHRRALYAALALLYAGLVIRLAGDATARSGAAGRATRNDEEAPVEKRALGEIRVHQRQDGLRTYSLRFRVNGKRRSITLGTDAEGWSDRRAERKLEDVLVEIRVGMWRPPAPPEASDEREMTFHEFASRWWAARKGELRHKTQLDYEWQLQKHLLPFFADYPVSEIDLALVERYREDKLIERERVRAAAEAG